MQDGRRARSTFFLRQIQEPEGSEPEEGIEPPARRSECPTATSCPMQFLPDHYGVPNRIVKSALTKCRPYASANHDLRAASEA